MTNVLYFVSFLVVIVLAVQAIHAYFPAVEVYIDEWQYCVERGDTLWALARAFYPMEDPRRIVWAIRMMNPELNPGALPVGRIIRMPTYEEDRG